MCPRSSPSEKGEGASRELRALIQRVGRTRRKQAQRILSRAFQILPHYRNLSASTRRDVRENVLYQIGLFYRVSLESGRQLTSQEIERLRLKARSRASQGVPLSEFLGMYQIGNTIVWEDLVASARSDQVEKTQLFDRVARITENQTQLMTAVTEAYVEERESLSRFRERDLDDFFQLLLTEEMPESLLVLRAKSLGIDPEDPHAVVFFHPAGPLETERAGMATEQLRRLLSNRTKEMGSHVGRVPDGFLLLVPGDPKAEEFGAISRSLFGDRSRAGIGRSARGMAGARQSAREALRAVDLGSFDTSKTAIHRYEDLAVLDLVRIGSPEAERFMHGVLGPLGPPCAADERYVDTLRQFASSGFRIKVAAAALSIHPHTLSYRLKRISDCYGIDMNDPAVRLRVQLALLIRDGMNFSSRSGG